MKSTVEFSALVHAATASVHSAGGCMTSDDKGSNSPSSF